MEDEFSAVCCCVNVLSQRDKIDPSIVEEVEALDEIFERTPQTVELPDGYGIPRPHKRQELLQPLALKF